ncbi:MAG TPA: hypothetical protein VLM85_05310 [Polyangiaceae bacterium]|nr:hypothetical protein [Polyangiaceae bacterium]
MPPTFFHASSLTKRLLLLLLLLALGCAACSRTSPHQPRYGEAMGEVGRRFELAGRAAAANRFELAAFEVDEMGEVFSQLPRAEPPKEGDAKVLPPMVEGFQKAELPELARAAKDKDGRAFGDAFARAAAACNACHVASGHGFIDIPTKPGKPVPDVDPAPSG